MPLGQVVQGGSYEGIRFSFRQPGVGVLLWPRTGGGSEIHSFVFFPWTRLCGFLVLVLPWGPSSSAPAPLPCRRGMRCVGVGLHKAARAGTEPKPGLSSSEDRAGSSGALPLTFLLLPFPEPEPGEAAGGGAGWDRKFTLPGLPEAALLQGHGFWDGLLGGWGAERGACVCACAQGEGSP